MKTNRKILLTGILLLAGLLLVVQTAPAAAQQKPLSAMNATPKFDDHTLDGKTYTGKMGKKGETEGNPETITFENGTLLSSACESYGFGSGSYKTISESGITRFEAETKSPTEINAEPSRKNPM